MSEILVNTIKKADGTGGLTVPTTAGNIVTTGGATFTGAVTGTDLTLSGGVYLGGTGAANKLDDYEEGTWTASFYTSTGGGGTLLGTKTATYTKIGRLVHVSYYADNVGSGIESIAGLPFSMTGYASGITADGVNFYTSTGMTVNYRTADNSYTRTEFVYQTTS